MRFRVEKIPRHRDLRNFRVKYKIEVQLTFKMLFAILINIEINLYFDSENRKNFIHQQQ